MYLKPIKRFLLLLFVIQLWPVPPTVACPQSSGSFLDQRIASFSVTNADVHVALQKLAITYKVPIGLELISEKEGGNIKTSFDINLKSCAVRDIVSGIVARDSRYQWKAEDGVITVFPVQHQETFLDVELPNFVVNDLTRPQLASTIVEVPVVKQRTQQLGITLRNFRSLPQDDDHSQRLSLRLKKVTVRRVLNEIVKDGYGYYWLVQIYGSRYGEGDKYFMLVL